ncbi:hypothetical protein [Nocardia sp. CY41]|uniref:hypothetical protein n=1 Tax=Nocardia sp. CY41 TaxID=2608686 RepID=UPI0013599427|nr:hypothetical protein [Nocardia sp. CY41]
MTAHRPAQVARHAAIVLAGAASLSLTAAAGAYIVQQIADTQRPDARIAAPVVPAAPDELDHGRAYVSYPALTSSSYVLPVAFSTLPATEPEVAEPLVDSPAAPPPPAPLAGRVRLGEAYVGAQFARTEADTVSVTVDTNALTVLTGFLRADPAREKPGTSGVTTMRTDLDTRNGAVRLALSDPELGERDLRLDRQSRPAPTGQATIEHTPATPQDETSSAAV